MPYRVLVVEDNLLNLELARDLLEANGFQVSAAVDAEQCADALRREWPDLVLMDIGLPGKDGLQITRELRADPATRDLVIVAMTAHAMVEDEQRARESGCDGYLTKPLRTRSLPSQVRAFIETGRALHRKQPDGGHEDVPDDHSPSGAPPSPAVR